MDKRHLRSDISNTRNDLAEDEQKTFENPKLTFIEPKLTKQGDATKITQNSGGFIGTFFP
jgi:hypothetical protein